VPYPAESTRRRARSVRAIGLLCLAARLACAADDGDTYAMPAEFSAKFAIEWKGITCGYSTFDFIRTGANSFTYRSQQTARGIFRLAFPDALNQTSNFSLVDGVLRPTSYHAAEEGHAADKSVDLKFDWQTHRVSGVSQTKPVDLPLQDGTQDGMSVQIELMRELAAGRSPQGFWLVDNDEIKQYKYVREGTETLETGVGKLETVRYRSEHEGSSRVTRLWLAQSLGYLPVRAERSRNGNADFSLEILELKRN
jgi:hypothetical protein